MRIFFCIFFFLFSYAMYSQQQNVKSIILKMYEASSDEEMKSAFQDVRKLSVNIMELESDSVKYLYHYCCAAGMELTDGNKEEKLEHIKEAIAFRENKIGIFSSEYLELLWAYASGLEESDLDHAIACYESALVKGQFLFQDSRSSETVRYWYGQCFVNLGNCYQRKGYQKEVVQAYRAGFDLMKGNYDKDDASSYLPLYLLSSFYSETQRDYKQAIAVMNEVCEYIKEHEGENNKRYAGCLYSIAVDYGQMKEYELAVEYYNKAVSIIKGCDSNYSEDLAHCYNNLFLLYVDLGQLQKAFELQPTIKDYYLHCDKQIDYYKMLWVASVMFAKKEKPSVLYEKILSDISHFSESQKIDLLLNVSASSFSEMSKKQETSINNDAMVQIFDWLQQAKELSRPLFGKKDVRYLRCLILQSDVNLSIGDSLASLQNMYEIRECLRGIGETTSDFYGNTLNRIDNMLRSRNEIHACIENGIELLAFTEKKFGKVSKERAYILNGLGIDNTNVAAYKEAKRCLVEAQNIFAQTDGKDRHNYIIGFHNQGRLEMLQGNSKKALQLLLKSKKLQLQYLQTVNPKTEQYINELSSK